MLNTKLILLLLVPFSVALFFACASRETKVEKPDIQSNRYENAPLSLAPGTANVALTILQSADPETKSAFLARIDTVFGYGPATPPLAVGSQITLETAQSLSLKNRELILKKSGQGTSHRVQLFYNGRKLSSSPSADWQIKQLMQ